MRSKVVLIGGAIVVAGIVAAIGTWMTPAAPYKPPDFSIPTVKPEAVHVPFPAPAFSLADQNGHVIAPAVLRGKVWLADFIYIGCDSTCTLLDASLAQVQHQMPQVEVASFCVDPYIQQPSVLMSYNRRYDGDPVRWHLLTGNEDQMFHVAEGFSVLPKGEPNPGWIDFQTWIVLIDGHGTVRAVYDGLAPDIVARLERDIRAVQAGGAPHPFVPTGEPTTAPASQPESAVLPNVGTPRVN